MQPNWLPKSLSLILEWAHQEQTIVAAVIALVGALLTVRAIRRQITTQQAQWNDEKLRSLRAQRARLVFALSEFVDYNKSYYVVCKQVFEGYELIRNGEIDVPELPPMPEAALEIAFSVLSQTLPDDVASTLERTTNALQTYHSRLSDGLSLLRAKNKFNGLSDKAAFAKRTQECLYFENLVGSLFDFARKETEGASEFPCVEHAIKQLAFKNMDDEYREWVSECIRQLWEHNEFRA
jgi:penicillin-binding protein-related factor A (putative recombinase)